MRDRLFMAEAASTRPHAWFAFPKGERADQEVRALIAAHAGLPLMRLSTPLPEEPELSLVQVLTFVDPELGYRHLLSDDVCRRFCSLALALHAGFEVQVQRQIAAIVSSTAPIRAAFDARQDELFLLAPTPMAPVVQRAIEELLSAPRSILDPWAPNVRRDRLSYTATHAGRTPAAAT